MKKQLRLILPAVIIAAALSSTLCHSQDTPPDTAGKTESKVDLSKPQYTFLKDCKDNTNHDNAAFTELSCNPLSEYKVNITEQSPQYFNIILSKDDYKVSSDFTTVSNENPVEAGKAIEWHLVNNIPKYMIFRISWGTTEEPFNMRQYLVVNLVTDKEICALATVDVKNNKNANQKARDLIATKFKQTTSCPATVVAL